MENHSLEAPVTEREYENWMTVGSSVFMKDKIILNPQVQDSKGGIYSLKPYPETEAWVADITLKIGNEEKTERGGQGFGFYYLQNLNT